MTMCVTEPRNVKQVLSHPDWKQSMQEDFNTLVQNDTWVLVPRFLDKKIIGSIWI